MWVNRSELADNSMFSKVKEWGVEQEETNSRPPLSNEELVTVIWDVSDE